MNISFSESDVVFIGKLVSNQNNFEFAVNSILKGEQLEKVIVSEIEDCNVLPVVDQEYVVYANLKNEKYYIKACSSTRPISDEYIPHLSNRLFGPNFFRPGVDSVFISSFQKIQKRENLNQVYHDLNFLQSKKIANLNERNSSSIVWMIVCLVFGFTLGLLFKKNMP